MENLQIRNALRRNGVKAWELAEALGIVDCTLSKWMRRELPEEKQAIMLEVIARVAESKREGGGEASENER